MKQPKPKRQEQCDCCHRKIEYGQDIIVVERAVIGPRGIICLDEKYYFCSQECISRYFDRDPNKILPRLPPRIP